MSIYSVVALALIICCVDPLENEGFFLLCFDQTGENFDTPHTETSERQIFYCGSKQLCLIFGDTKRLLAASKIYIIQFCLLEYDQNNN